MGAVALTIGIAVYALMHENYGLMAMMLAVAPGIALINNPSAWMVTILAVSQSGLILPGLPRGLQVFQFLVAGFSLMVVARNILLKPPMERQPLSFAFIWGLMGVLAFIIVERGLGFMAMGGNTIGGASYIKVLVAAAFLLASRSIPLTTQQWKFAIVLMIGGSFVPVAAQLIHTFSGGSFYVYKFVEYYGGVRDTLVGVETGTQVVRFQTLGPVADTLLMAVLVFTGRQQKFSIVTLAGLAACLVIAGLTGFRSLLLQIVGIAFVFRFFIAPRHDRMRLSVVSLLCGLFLLILLIPFTQHLPQSMQRALSWLPFAQIDSVASLEAGATIDWRLDLWEFSWEHVPDFLWVGRGFALNIDDILAYSVFKDDILSSWFSHNYHNGPLGALIDTGLPGLTCLMLFFFFSTKEVLLNRRNPTDPFVSRFYTVIKAKYLYSVFAYLFIHGDIRSSLPNLFLLLTIFYGLQVTDHALSRKRIERDFSIIDPSFGSSHGRTSRG